jgi:hypothetical protein
VFECGIEFGFGQKIIMNMGYICCAFVFLGPLINHKWWNPDANGDKCVICLICFTTGQLSTATLK